ncbi:unnamed protein product [Protopolystoma xenopodis]|uniref:Uncharacterized protein n=1 Tax=Protopolystoma xenopodis TaxID=117903 RepID=A0A3S5AHH2_9PLAT|nr:unnamed protein product [Protopolystoma xenopodis]
MGTERSEIAERIVITGHAFDWNATKRLTSYGQNTRKQKIREAVDILFQRNLMNRRLEGSFSEQFEEKSSVDSTSSHLDESDISPKQVDEEKELAQRKRGLLVNDQPDDYDSPNKIDEKSLSPTYVDFANTEILSSFESPAKRRRMDDLHSDDQVDLEHSHHQPTSPTHEFVKTVTPSFSDSIRYGMIKESDKVGSIALERFFDEVSVIMPSNFEYPSLDFLVFLTVGCTIC